MHSPAARVLQVQAFLSAWICSNCYWEFLRWDSVIVGKLILGEREREGGLSIARTACWWIFWLTVSSASLLLTPHRPCLLFPINLSYCSRRLWGCQGQVWRGRRWEEGRGWERREAGLTGPRWPASTPVLLPSPAHLHRQNGFSRHSAALFSSPSSSIYTHAASIHFQY